MWIEFDRNALSKITLKVIILLLFFILEHCVLKLFSKYLTVGVFNTAIHWFVFAVGVYMFSVNQAAANFLAFATAVTFSFFANAANWSSQVEKYHNAKTGDVVTMSINPPGWTMEVVK